MADVKYIMDCGAEVVWGLSGRIKERCDACQQDRNKISVELSASNRARYPYSSEKAKLNQLKKEASRNRYDCGHRNKCLTRYASRHDQIEAQYIEECYQCQKYESVPIERDLYVWHSIPDYYYPPTHGVLHLRNSAA